MKKITKKKLTKLQTLENSTWSVLINISWTSWGTDMYFTFLESIFYNKQLCKSTKSCKTIFYTWYSPKHQSNFFCTSLYLSLKSFGQYSFLLSIRYLSVHLFFQLFTLFCRTNASHSKQRWEYLERVKETSSDSKNESLTLFKKRLQFDKWADRLICTAKRYSVT